MVFFSKLLISLSVNGFDEKGVSEGGKSFDSMEITNKTGSRSRSQDRNGIFAGLKGQQLVIEIETTLQFYYLCRGI